jgi:hypothetical protein
MSGVLWSRGIGKGRKWKSQRTGGIGTWRARVMRYLEAKERKYKLREVRGIFWNKATTGRTGYHLDVPEDFVQLVVREEIH